MYYLNHKISTFMHIEVLIILFLAIIIWRRRKVEGAKSLFFTCLCALIYTFGYNMEIVSANLSQIDFWGKFQYIGLSFIPYFWFRQATAIAAQNKKSVKRISFLFFFMSVLTYIIRLTNSYHQLMYKNMRLVSNGYFNILQFDPGIWYQIFYCYFILCTILSMIYYYQTFRNSTGYFRQQMKILFISSCIPILSVTMNILKLTPLQLDCGPFFILILYIVYAYAIYHYDLMHVIPLSRKKIFEWIYDGIIVIDMNFSLKDYNHTAKAIFPSLDRSNIGIRLDLCTPQSPDFFSSIKRWYEQHKSLLPSEAVTPEEVIEFSILSKESFPLYFRARPMAIYDKDFLIGITILISNITKEKELLMELTRAAQIDTVTGILNRRYFIEQLHKQLDLLKQQSENGILIMFDLDKFKKINDNYGHQTGDYVLNKISSLASDKLQANDLFGRYGGEEFIIFLPSISLEKAASLVDDIRITFQNYIFKHNGKTLRLTASFGITKYYNQKTKSYYSFDEMVSIADDALYKAKANGRNQYVIQHEKI